MIRFGCMINDMNRFNTVLRESELPGNILYVTNPDSATKGLNSLLDRIDKDDVIVLAHQDMYFRSGWFSQLVTQLTLMPDDWQVAGIFGKDERGRPCGRIRDMRFVHPLDTSEVHKFPCKASCFDECVIIAKGDFRFDEGLDGFDLYGSLAVLQAEENGRGAYIIDAPAEHYCMRPFTWYPDKEFERRYKWLMRRFPNKTINSTVLGGNHGSY